MIRGSGVSLADFGGDNVIHTTVLSVPAAEGSEIARDTGNGCVNKPLP
jgi:hypothetical protein